VERADEAPTANELPARAAAERRLARTPLEASAAGPDSDAQMSQRFAIATLREEEVDSARTMIRVGRLIGMVAVAPLPFLHGSTLFRLAVLASVGLAIVVGFVVDRRLRSRDVDVDRVLLQLVIAVSPGIFIGTLYFGVFSAVQLFPALALYFFSRREQLRTAFALFLVNAVSQAVAATLFISGTVADPGLVHPALPAWQLVVGHSMIQISFFGAFLLGRGSYRASRDAIAKMQSAMRLVAQREAQLLEAREDLDRALQIDSPGRFTERVLGQYRLGNVIGRGGMGEVYEAWHTANGEIAAVKLLAQRELGNPASVERFLREVRAVRTLTSPHVVRVLAACDERDPIPYFVMERLHGQDLAHHLRGGKLDPRGLDNLLAQVGAAVEEAWAQGIVHRDLKPQNLFLADAAPRPIWKVLDFGVAALDENSGTLTQGKVVGTPSYMAPEQARGERVDHRADVYALAAIAYRWLTGRPVVTGRDLHTALYQTVHVMPERPGALVELPPDIDAVLAIGLVKDPEQRWSSVSELRTALAAALADNLDPALRTRGEMLVAAHPWGAVRA
jgi:serine/threonine-protein kinase